MHTSLDAYLTWADPVGEAIASAWAHAGKRHILLCAAARWLCSDSSDSVTCLCGIAKNGFKTQNVFDHGILLVFLSLAARSQCPVSVG